jgi:hypothetical protein
MSLYFPQEFATHVIGKDGLVTISQFDRHDVEHSVVLTVHQFEEIFNRHKTVIHDALHSEEIEE